MRKNRVPQNKIYHKRVLILCEGESEQRYLLNYKTLKENKDRLRHVQIEVLKPDNHSPLGLVNEAKKHIQDARKDRFPWDKAWIVFDKDGHANIPNAFEEAARANPAIDIAFTAKCFEIWIFLHYDKINRYFDSCDDVIKKLSEIHCPDYHKMKLDSGIYTLMDTAIQNAKWLMDRNRDAIDRGARIHELDCFTSMHYLMEYLKNL